MLDFHALHVQVFCQLCNFVTMTSVTLALTSLGQEFPIRHHINIMMCAINYLPGQVCSFSYRQMTEGDYSLCSFDMHKDGTSVVSDSSILIPTVDWHLEKFGAYPCHTVIFRLARARFLMDSDAGGSLLLQVRVSVFAPILAVEGAGWVVVGAIQRQYNPLHSAPVITT